MGVLVRSFVLGVAAGGRASTGAFVPVEVALRERHGTGATVARVAVRLAVLAEFVGDKLPQAGSRLAPPALAGRVVAGAGGALALAVVERRTVLGGAIGAVLGGVGAWVGSVGGASWREWAADADLDALHPDLRAALVEDAVVLGTAAALVGSAP